MYRRSSARSPGCSSSGPAIASLPARRPAWDHCAQAMCSKAASRGSRCCATRSFHALRAESEPMKLYNYPRSSAAYRVRIALNVKGLDYESIQVELRAPESAQRSHEFLALNPEGLVPVLVDGERVLTQSLAIIEYLDETRPQLPLLPAKPRDRAQVRSLAQAVACDTHPLNNLRVLNYLRQALRADDAAVQAWYEHWIAQSFTALESQVQKTTGDGRYMFG